MAAPGRTDADAPAMALSSRMSAVALRPFTPEDARVLLALSHEQGLRTWIPDQVYEDEAQAAEVVAYLIAQCANPAAPGGAPFVLGVCLPDGELVGHVGLSPLHGSVEIGYAIADGHQGRGLATSAVRAMLDLARERFALPEVLGIVASDNAASCRVLEKAGFVLAEESERSLHGVTRMVRTYRWR